MIDRRQIRRTEITLAVGAVGGSISGLLGLPAGWLTAAMAAVPIAAIAGTQVEVPTSLRNVAFVVTGSFLGSSVSPALVSGGLSPLLMIAAYIVLGSLVGSRFAGISLNTLWAMSAASLGAFVVSMSIAIAGAAFAAWLTGQPASQMILAFAPGGIDVMTIMPFALHLDAAFVAAHQLARFLMITVYASLLMKRSCPPSDIRE